LIAAGPVPPFAGQWYAGPHGTKVGRWRSTPGKLAVEGRRLDAPAPPLRATVPDGYGDYGFQSTSILLPTGGCWEITAQVGTGHTFRLVARVLPEHAHPFAETPVVAGR
jgi:hypothetical protein